MVIVTDLHCLLSTKHPSRLQEKRPLPKLGIDIFFDHNNNATFYSNFVVDLSIVLWRVGSC